MTDCLWDPGEARRATAAITRFRQDLARRTGLDLADFNALHRASVTAPGPFWREVWRFGGIIGDPGAGPWFLPAADPRDARFFPDARLNFAANMLRRRDDGEAIVFYGENRVRRHLSWRQLYDQVAACAAALSRAGVGPGDRVAGYLPNVPEAAIAMLASAAIGAVWSSASPDFGARGVLDRFGQIEPKVLIACDGYFYNGKTHDLADRLRTVTQALPGLRQLVTVPYIGRGPGAGAIAWDDWLGAPPAGDIAFRALPFDHPLVIVFSSGTTGAPKCIVHRAGGVLLQHVKEHRLHCDIRPGDRVFYFTTTGWMMWNWLLSALASEATVLLYDGSPFYPDGNALFDYAAAEGMTLLGTSARWIDAVRQAGLTPRQTHRLDALRCICSTGSPLAPESFHYVYASVKPDVQLASISGGTDILSCFMLGNPAAPVWAGEIQAPGLGLAVDVFDRHGRPAPVGVRGELVCTRPFPSMPLGFWQDEGRRRYRQAYFDRFPGVWCHGDFVARTARGGFVIHGRSDAVLNPGGVRIGTAEIYRQVEQLPEIVESLAIGQNRHHDVRVVLFVRLRPGARLDTTLADKIRHRLRSHCTPRHVPAKIVAVADIPRTRSGKIAELAVRDIVHGRTIANREALANPEALDLFQNLPDLQD